MSTDFLRDPESRPDYGDDVYEDGWDEWEDEDDWLDMVSCECRVCKCTNYVTGGLKVCSKCFHGEHKG